MEPSGLPFMNAPTKPCGHGAGFVTGQGLPLQFVAELRHVAALICFECRSSKTRKHEENMRI